MNVSNLTNHIKYDDIFSRNTVEGKIQWCKIACDKDLPMQFIDQYFSKLKNFGIEKLQKLDDFIISQHADELNWYSLLKYQFLSEDVLNENLERLTRMKLWALALKTQKLSYEFLVKNISRYRNDSRALKSLCENMEINDSVKQKISSLISSND